MTTSLITGGAGFIGAHIGRELIKLGHRVVVMDDLSGGFRENLDDNIIFVQGSIMESNLVDSLFKKYSFTYVYHLAAYAAEGLSHFIKRYNYQNNLIGSINLINASVNHKVKCFVFTSSIAVYGRGQLPMREEMNPAPEDPYGISKLAVELDLKCTHEMFGLPFIVFRPHNVFGEYQNLGDKYRNVVGIFINQLMQGVPLTIFGDGTQTRAFSYVGNIAQTIANSVNVSAAYNQIFNVGADEIFTVAELAQEVCNAMQIKSKIRFLPSRNEVNHAYSDHSKVRAIFGQNETVNFQEGLKRMITWAHKAGIRKSLSFSNIEILEKLPPVWLE